jgi:REP element-mobilizing transposase RayT
MPSRARQLSLPLPTWGGKRRGAGRKPAGEKALVSHAARLALSRRTPVHVVLRVLEDVASLRSDGVFSAVRDALRAGNARDVFRIVHYSVLHNHLHLLAEAEDKSTLSRGVQGLAVRIARGVNRALDRRGPVFADHYFAHALPTPAEVRRARHYVVHNQLLHLLREGHRPPAGYRDPCSSLARGAPVVAARTWLLRAGWKRSRAGPAWDELVPL